MSEILYTLANIMFLPNKVPRCWLKMGQIGPKWDKSGTFSDQISEHFGATRQNVLKSDLKKSRIYPFCGQSAPLLAQIW